VSLRIPGSRPATQRRSLDGRLDQAVQRVLERGVYTPDVEVATFESAFAAATGTRYAVGTASGGWAITVALRAAGVGPGDEVLSVPNVDIAAAAPVSHTGADLRWVDVELGCHGMDADALLQRIGPRTRAIVVVHLYGFPARMDALLEIAERHDLVVIEDGSLATGAGYGDRRVGGLGTAGVFSLSSTKPLNAAGKAGVLVTDDEELAARARVLVNYGFELDNLDAINRGEPGVPFLYRTEGYNAALDELQAAVLSAKLPHLTAWVERRRDHDARYRRWFAGHPRIRSIEPVPGSQPSPRVHVIRVPNRDQVLRHLFLRGIAASLAYVPALHLQELYAHKRPPEGFPVCEQLQGELLCLPCYPELEGEEVDEVAAAVLSAVA
jgi:dTDP-4-amino-4,6-dideoxygalactose transaminase